MGLKFCPNLSFMFLEATTLLERYELARKAGFKGVECGFPYDHEAEELAEAKNKSGLQHILINAYAGDWDKGFRGLAALPGREDDFKQSIDKAIHYAKALDCKMIHIMSGVVEEETHEHYKVYTHNLSLAADLFSKNDIIGLIEPISRYSIPNYFMSSFNRAIKVIKEVNKPNLKLQLDIFHLQQICGDLTRHIEQFLPIVGHVQIAQVPNRNGPFSPGEINYDYVFYLLRKFQYKGWIGLEYHSTGQTHDALAWVNDMQEIP